MIMNTDSNEPVVDWDFDLDNIDFDNIDFDSLFEDQLAEALKDPCVEATATNPNIPSQPSMPSIDGGTNMGGESSNVIQQNMNQNQSLLQQATGTSVYLISGGGQQQGNNIYPNLFDPVGFATPDEFVSANAYHQYILRQIKILKERYNNELVKTFYNVMELRNRATNMEDSKYYGSVITYLERIMTFLNITRVELLPQNDQMIYNIMNMIVNYVIFYINKPGYYSQLRDLDYQPLGAMRLQDNPSPSLSQRVTSLEPNMYNFSNSFSSRRPHPQTSQSRLMPSSINTASYQTARLPGVQSPTQQINLGPMTSSVIGSSYPISLFPNTTTTNFPARPLIQQRPVANQNFNFERMKAPMHQTNELTGSKVRHGMSPLCSGLVNQCSRPSNANPIPLQTSTSTSKFVVNSVLSPHSTARSPFVLSSNSSCPSKTPMNPPSQEPKSSKDQAFHLTGVVKPVTKEALISSSTDISPIEKVTDTIPACVPPYLVSTHIHIQDETSGMLEYDHEPLQNRKRELSVPSVYSDQFVSQGRDTCLTETSANKRKKIEKSAILEEIKKINNQLLETSIDAVIDPSEDDFSILGSQEGTIVKCLFRNVCSLLGPQKGASSEKMPEFVILLLVPDNYPASSPQIIRSNRDVLNNEPWGTLYHEMLTKFNLSLYGITGIPCLGDMARNWDASARAVVTEFLQKRGGKSFSDRYGSWDNCLNSSSSSN